MPTFFYRHRIEIMMWMLIAEILASPLADEHRKAGAVLALLILSTLMIGLSYVGDRRVIRVAVVPAAVAVVVARLVASYKSEKG